MQRYQVPATIDYAGFWIRLAAFLIDGIILVAINWVINTIWTLASGGGFMARVPTEPLIETTGPTWPLGAVVAFLVFVAYIIFFWRWKGQTPGKMVMRLKITRIDGSNIGWGAVILRLLGYVPSLLFAFVGFIWICFDIHRQGLHDKIADTYVIRLPRK